MKYCPRCQKSLVATKHVPGHVVWGCTTCKQFQVEGSDKWVEAGDGFRESLRIIAAGVKQEQDTVKAIMESPIDDPRWERLA